MEIYTIQFWSFKLNQILTHFNGRQTTKRMSKNSALMPLTYSPLLALPGIGSDLQIKEACIDHIEDALQFGRGLQQVRLDSI
ncbi:hypothetical protein FGO68_gene15573 [Halteria grandinella]|uniref:Uncharacterized protein n=1 Tax=Halteria grandinella TaxID=5974 RepID=A0A8J8NCD1_HALGN|nr:hypothetical protein FGO68_gene15573 [Halteria grandinella]